MAATEGFRRIGKLVVTIGWIQLVVCVLAAAALFFQGVSVKVPSDSDYFGHEALLKGGAIFPVTPQNITPRQVYNAVRQGNGQVDLPYALSKVEQDLGKMDAGEFLFKYRDDGRRLIALRAEVSQQILHEAHAKHGAESRRADKYAQGLAALAFGFGVLIVIQTVMWIARGFAAPAAK